ncbi:MAG: adenylyl-sulfate kinase [Candidatus Nanopelagicales bacterium]
MRCILLTGDYGAGKTAVAMEMSQQLSEAGLRSATVDMDWLAWVGPDLSLAELRSLKGQNLATVVTNFRSFGIDHLVLAGMLKTAHDRGRVAGAVGECEFTVVRLLVTRDEARRRIAAQDVGQELKERLADADEIAAAVEAANVEDFTVDNQGASSIEEVAREVLSRCEWL